MESVTLTNELTFAKTLVPAWQYFFKPLPGGKVAVLLINNAEETSVLKLKMQTVPGIKGEVEARDIWAQEDLEGKLTDFQRSVPSHGSVFLLLSPVVTVEGTKLYV